MNFFNCVFILILTIQFSFAQDLSRGKLVKEIETARKMATLKFTTIVNGKGDEFTGFFYGKDGHFITVHHSFRSSSFISTKNAKINIMDSEGNEYKEGVINSCTNENNVDICVGQIKNYKPKFYFVDLPPTFSPLSM